MPLPPTQELGNRAGLLTPGEYRPPGGCFPAASCGTICGATGICKLHGNSWGRLEVRYGRLADVAVE